MIGFPKQLLTNRSPELQRKFFSGSNLRMILLVVALTILQGCGGSETNGRGSEPTSSPGCWAPSIICGTAPPAITLTGRISGPVIAGATVCVDRNRNVQCDSGEPSAISDTKGGFNITDVGDTKGLFLVAHIEANSIDLNLGPIGKPFFLVGPASNQSELEHIAEPKSGTRKSLIVVAATKSDVGTPRHLKLATRLLGTQASERHGV
jgi:hypothetical protein